MEALRRKKHCGYKYEKMKVELLPIDDQWVNAIVNIERTAHTHPWSDSMLRQSPTKFSCNRVLLIEGDVIGYFYAQCISGNASLLNIAVVPAYQGKGYGKRLLVTFLESMSVISAQEAWLEVRQSNVSAIRLYESQGFNEFDRRNDYYPTALGTEDALIMSYWFDE